MERRRKGTLVPRARASVRLNSVPRFWSLPNTMQSGAVASFGRTPKNAGRRSGAGRRCVEWEKSIRSATSVRRAGGRPREAGQGSFACENNTAWQLGAVRFDRERGTRDEARRTGPQVPRRLSCLRKTPGRESGLRLRWGQGFGFRSSFHSAAKSISRRRSENANP